MNFKRVAAVLNTLILRGLGSGIAVLFTVMVSRHLPTDSAARFFLLFNISTIAAVCFRWGLDEVIIRRVAKLSAEEIPKTAQHLAALSHRRVALWVVICLLLLSVVVWHPTFQNTLVAIDTLSLINAIFAAAFVALSACIARILQGSGRTNLATFLLNIVVPGLSLLGLLVLISSKKADARDLILLYTCVSAVVYLFTTISFYGNPLGLLLMAYKLKWEGVDSSAANKLGVVVLAQQVLGWAALLIVPYSYGDEAYKGFVVVQKLATLISLAMLAVNFTFSRRFASLYAAGDLQQLRRIVRYSLLTIMIASIGGALFLVLTRQWLFAYAEVSNNMTTMLLILLISQLFFDFCFVFNSAEYGA